MTLLRSIISIGTLSCLLLANSASAENLHFTIAARKKINPKNVTLQSMHEHFSSTPSDINEHLPILRDLAKECESVTEIGVRSMVSTWSLLYGLSINHGQVYTAIDIDSPSAESLLLAQKLSTKNGISFNFIKENDMNIDIDNTDLLFIDSLHTYAHLTYELEKFCFQTNKYIALHDTSDPWGTVDDNLYHGDFSEYPSTIDKTKRGLWLAVEDFLEMHPEWVLKERRTNNHGLTILQRIGTTHLLDIRETGLDD